MEMQMKRYGMVIGLNEERIEEYKELHEHYPELVLVDHPAPQQTPRINRHRLFFQDRREP